ncbi:MAG: beta-lactamase family protein [Deltaproteobacteria bacterium]|nr:beta-lactamase family protein [Deltaproteobacteria bacterium]
MRAGIWGLAVAVAIGCSSAEEPKGPSLDETMIASLEATQLPGFSAAIVKGGKVVLAKGWGVSDVASSRPMTERDILVVGSLSKTVTGATIMTLVESGKLSLDRDVSEVLPFPVRNPKWPDVPITLRMLMTHTSSIQEAATRLVSLAKPGDPTVTLRDLLEPYLVPGGKTYVEGESFGAQKPGDKFVYSNFGAALAALVAEIAVGESFHGYCKRAVLDPLGMRSTSFWMADLPASQLATHYTWVPSKGQVANPQTSVPYYPATALRTTAADLGRFLAAIARGGELDGVRILKAETVAEMTKIQVAASAPGNDITGQGLFWEHRPVADRPAWGHGGSYYGASARMHLDGRGVGVIVLANGDLHLRIAVQREEQMAAWGEVERRLWRHADGL